MPVSLRSIILYSSLSFIPAGVYFTWATRRSMSNLSINRILFKSFIIYSIFSFSLNYINYYNIERHNSSFKRLKKNDASLKLLDMESLAPRISNEDLTRATGVDGEKEVKRLFSMADNLSEDEWVERSESIRVNGERV